MATSGTAVFTLDLAELIDEAYERCGGDRPRSGYDFKTARRSLNMLLSEWANLGVNLWTIDTGTIPLIQGQAVYDMPLDTVDVLETMLATTAGGQTTETTLNRVSVSTYASLPNKTQQGRPVQVLVRRGTPQQYVVWPVPNQTGVYAINYWRLRRMEDAGDGGNTQDVPFRFLPALVAGLAYMLALKVPNAIQRLPILKAQYDEALQLAMDEDREKADVRFLPRIYRS